MSEVQTQSVDAQSAVSGLMFGRQWLGAALRAIGLFGVGYALPMRWVSDSSRWLGFVQLLVTALCIWILAVAIYRFLSQREAELAEDELAELAALDEEDHQPVGKPAEQTEATESEEAPAAPAAPRLEPRLLGQTALERLSMAVYQFNGLRSQTVATGVPGEYRIRLLQRNTDTPVAILRCAAGPAVQDESAYRALLAVMEDEQLEKGFFVAPAGFAPEVSAVARSRHVTLVDEKLLLAMIDRLPDSAKELLTSAAH